MLPPELQQKVADAQRQLENYRKALLADEELARKRANTKAVWIACACVALLLAAGIAGWLRVTGPAETLGLMAAIAIGGIVVTLVVATKPSTEFFTAYDDAYKTELNNAIVKHISPELSYIEEDGISRETFAACGLFDTPDCYGTSDLVSGACAHGGGKTHVQLARVFAEKWHTIQTGRSSRISHETLFDGVMLVLDAGKTFRGSTQVLWNNIVTPAEAATPSPDRLTQLGNSEFEKEFSVHASDPAEARAILTAPLMRNILALARRREIPMIRFSFKDTSITVAIDNAGDDEDDSGYDPFDPDFDHLATDIAQFEKIYDQFAFYLGIVDSLDLNRAAEQDSR